VNTDLETLKLARLQLEAESVIRRQMLGLAPDGSAGEPQAAWAALVDSKVVAGLSRVEAIRQAGREKPELYRQQLVPLALFLAARR
jgi:hypothetical protein